MYTIKSSIIPPLLWHIGEYNASWSFNLEISFAIFNALVLLFLFSPGRVVVHESPPLDEKIHIPSEPTEIPVLIDENATDL